MLSFRPSPQLPTLAVIIIPRTADNRTKQIVYHIRHAHTAISNNNQKPSNTQPGPPTADLAFFALIIVQLPHKINIHH
jgi:hypothetical protein